MRVKSFIFIKAHRPKATTNIFCALPISKIVLANGVLLFSKKRVSEKCKVEDVVENIKIDVSNLDVGDAVLVRDLPEMPNIKILDKPDVAIVGVIKAK